MKGPTLERSIRRENEARLKLIPLGYKSLGEWRFEKDGSVHDLSAMDIDKWLAQQATKGEGEL